MGLGDRNRGVSSDSQEENRRAGRHDDGRTRVERLPGIAAADSGRGRLLFVVNAADFFVSHRLPIAVAARDFGWEVHVAAAADASVATIEAAGLHFHSVPISRVGVNPLKELGALWCLFRLYRRLRPDLVHHVTIKPVLYGSICARAARVPAVVNAISGLGYVFLKTGVLAGVRRRLTAPVYRLAFAHPNGRIIFQNSDDLAEFVRRRLFDGEGSRIIRGSGVDPAMFTPGTHEAATPIVVLASRMLYDKGVREFVDAARRLRGCGIDARFVLVGDTDANPAAVPREQLEAWSREGAVEWWGHRTDMPEVFRQADVACLPSYGEGLPKVLLEAAAAGLPIVATDVPGCREVVADGENGLLVLPRDAAQLAGALQALIEHPGKRRAMGRAGRERVLREFTTEHVVRQTLDLYEDVRTSAAHRRARRG